MTRPTPVLVVNAGQAQVDTDPRITGLVSELQRAGYGTVFVEQQRSPMQIVQTVLHGGFEVVVLVGFPLLSLAHLNVVPRVMNTLRLQLTRHVHVFVAATVPLDDVQELERHGVRHVFTPGLGAASMVRHVREALAPAAA